jgi:adenosylcobinamide kinase/adenosylcobinamide-phosphate guanylyltransferase
VVKLTLILGGARSGKSTYAEELAVRLDKPTLYIATAEALDDEMAQRIQRHKEERPRTWQTLEVPIDIAQTLKGMDINAGIILLDCLTLLVSNIMTQWTEDIDHPQEDMLFEKVEKEAIDLLSIVSDSAAEWIVVSNEVGLGLVPPYPMGRIYRDALGMVNKLFAQQADEVIFMIAGIPMMMVTPDSID